MFNAHKFVTNMITVFWELRYARDTEFVDGNRVEPC